MTGTIWDVIVVGAGPAGSSAAYDLALAGQKVLLLDKADFPRDKPCGGGLTPKTLKRLRFDVSEVIERVCHRMNVTYKGEGLVALPEYGPICAMVQRPSFDKFLRDNAIQVCAEFQVAEVESIKQESDTILLYTNRGGYQARWVIAADGSKSPLRRLLHNRPVVRQAFALEGKAALEKDTAIHLDFFVVPWGYGWIFPKGDHLNVGIGTFNRKMKISRKDLLDYCQDKLGHQDLREVVGYPLGLGPANGRYALGRVLFVGDAAGSVEGLMGEGIHNAITTGQIAAKVISLGGPVWWVRWHYWLRLRRHWLDVASSWNLARLFYRFPRLGFWMMTRSWFMKRLAKGFSLGWRLDKIMRGF